MISDVGSSSSASKRKTDVSAYLRNAVVKGLKVDSPTCEEPTFREKTCGILSADGHLAVAQQIDTFMQAYSGLHTWLQAHALHQASIHGINAHSACHGR